MLRVIATSLFGIICLAGGLLAGIWFGPQLKLTAPVQYIQASLSQLPWVGSIGQSDANSPFESYQYPTIKWRPKPLSDAPDALAQLWTTFEPTGGENNSSGSMKYKLTLFKATGRQQCEVQLLDKMGFKLMQFSASDFHAIPGAPDIVEARDSYACPEEEYKKVADYSIK